jgi:hypothetical protein
MATKPKKPADPATQARLRAELRRDIDTRETSYRERALKLFPHICARCCREFSGSRLRELTVHHKDHDHSNNPLDGRNWELLCLYCHDNEHEKFRLAGHHGGGVATGGHETSPIANPFAGLDALLKNDSGKPQE